MNTSQTQAQNKLLDIVLAQQNIKNDAALSKVLEMAPPQLSKIRSGKQPVGPTLILNLHERFAMPVAEIRALLAGGA